MPCAAASVQPMAACLSFATWLACVAAGASPGPLVPAAAAPAADARTMVIDCTGERLVVLRVGSNATVLLRDRGVTLPPLGGSRFGDGRALLELLADGSARWSDQPGAERDCAARPERAVAATMRLRGSLLTGLGSGASWRVEVLPDAQGAATIRFEAPIGSSPRWWGHGVSRRGVPAGRLEFAASAEHGPIRLELSRAACAEARFDAPGRVLRVYFRADVYEGCARLAR
jgi:hypothetical protein